MDTLSLLRFKVRDFRSVKDSGWIDTDRATALIGVNESGKTNLLMPLWKLKPAKNGEISPMADYPRRLYNDFRQLEDKPIFIEAEFETSAPLKKSLRHLLNVPTDDELATVIVSRDFDGKYAISFPSMNTPRLVKASTVVDCLKNAKRTLESLEATGKEDSLKNATIELCDTESQSLSSATVLNSVVLERILEQFKALEAEKSSGKRSPILALVGQVIDLVTAQLDQLKEPTGEALTSAVDAVVDSIPSFVYYSNYGNLDSEIYLPHVIANMKRDQLGQKEEAKVRTLKVLFDFVKLKPEEILELGRDFKSDGAPPTTDAEIDLISKKKKERSILLQSASTALTTRFKDWWKQGDYRFRFEADGDHFRIWVSDDKRPEEIELEGRSTGLQWFLSFYLVFLVESTDSHEGSILLLDEPGLSLHPLAQEDLSLFFDSLSQSNQLLYTTHSPFLVDADHLDRVRSVYVDSAGITQVSEDLRASEGDPSQTKSIYAVHAALGLSVSETLLHGCQPVIVEGQSDQTYLSMIKNYLIGKRLINPTREIVFIPAGGTKGIAATVAIVTGKEEARPFVILDSDGPGKSQAKALLSGVYSQEAAKVLSAGEFSKLSDNAEIEDLLPRSFFARVVGRFLSRPSGSDEDFEDTVQEQAPIIPQIEAYANKHGISLERGWKVQLAKRVKLALLKGSTDPIEKDTDRLEAWKSIFTKIQSSGV